MSRFVTTALGSFVLYLLLTTATGTAGIWSLGELGLGMVLAVLVAALTKNVVTGNWVRFLSPRRCALCVVYLFGPFLWAMAKANFDVVYRVITGRIKPGIVRISPQLKNDASVALLANSITLTPGTLSVDVDEKTNDLFVHWINVDESVLARTPRDHTRICGGFPEWARRIAE
ncbi:Na+/H+ antiporter subunit E [Chloroflexota bacterium]